MTTLEKYNEIKEQIKAKRAELQALQREAEELIVQLDKELQEPKFIAHSGFYAMHSDGTYETCYYNISDRTIYTAGLLFKPTGEKIGKRVGLKDVRTHIDSLKLRGYKVIA